MIRKTIKVLVNGRVIARVVPERNHQASARARLKKLRKSARLGDVMSPSEQIWRAERGFDRLAATKNLRVKPFDRKEFDGLMGIARAYLEDARRRHLAPESRIVLADGAARVLSLAALRWHGYRAEDWHVILQTLGHTLRIDPAELNVLTSCHKRVANCEAFDVKRTVLAKLLNATDALIKSVAALGASK